MDEIVNDFLIESGENLDRLDQELVRLEGDPQSMELLASIFRTIHTIKGSCGFLGFTRLEKVAHAGESLLSRLRDGELTLTAQVTTGLLAMVDAVRQMLSEIRSTQRDGDNDYPALREELNRLQQGEGNSPAASQLQSDARADLTVSKSDGTAAASQSTQESEGPTSTSADSQSSYRPAVGKMGGLLVERGTVKAADLAMALREQDHGDQRRLGEILVSLGVCKQEDILAAQQIIEARSREASTETVRVGVNLLDKLMNLVGELVLARNQLLQFAGGTRDKSFLAISQRLNLIATELQGEVMKTRMQPIGNVWNKFPRTVRDLALSCGKEVRLEMEGQDTELDKTIIEGIKDPLTHLVRNAVDHGIESPQARRDAGKDATGVLKLRAFHESGQVNIEISDDGAGLNGERIRKKALERGLITAQQAERMPDREAFNLIFLPGFSTADKVTNVSGRGVGMDVVKTNVEKIGGAVDIQSTPGHGTTVCVRIPLTLAIIPALMVKSQGERFAIPQMNLTELVRLDGGKGIESLQGSPVYRLRGRLLPLVSLANVLPTPAALRNFKAAYQETANIVVVQAIGRQFGLVVDDILNTEEIVVKPLAPQLKGINAYAGATIMGDGSVALILDVKGLAERAGIASERQEPVAEETSADVGECASRSLEGQTVILAENGAGTRFAISLGTVARLEEFKRSVLQRVGEMEAMHYRGHIIPLIRLSEVFSPLTVSPNPEGSTIRVVVCSEQGRTIGLIVDRIVDIVQQDAVIESVNQRHGVIGTCMLDGKMTDVLDVPAIVRAAVPGYAEATAMAGS